jgi:hypothetical protein
MNMATQNFQLIHWDGTKQKRSDSQSMELKLGKLAIGSLADIREVSGKLDFAGIALTNLGAPSVDSDAATKKFVDDSIAAISSGSLAALEADVDQLQTDLAQEILDRAAGDVSTLASAEAYADTKIADLINSAPPILDTLKEIATALGNDGNFATTITNSIAAVQGEVDAVELALAAETLARQTADTGLSSRLTALETFKDSQVLFVSKSGSDVTGTGGQHKPFASVGAALAAITDASPTKRYLIKVLAGAYTEGAIALKANVFICGDQKEAVRISASSFALASDFSGSGDHRSGMSKLIIAAGNCNFDWSAVTSAAGKLYFSEVSTNGSVTLTGHNNAIAQAQFDSCLFYSNITISGINVGVFNNNICFGNITLNQHPNGGMATILAATGGQVGGTVTLTTTVNDFNRRCSLFAKNFYMEYVTINGASSYADMNEGSLPRSYDRIVSQNGGNIVYITSSAPHAANVRNLGEAGKQYTYVFGYVHASSDSDLYLISMGADYNPSNTGRSIFLEADSYGLAANVNGGDINLTTAAVSGTGVRGKLKLDGRVIDVSAKKIVDLASGTDSTDAVNKGQLDVVAGAVSTEQSRAEAAEAALDGRLDTIEGSGAGSIAKAQADAQDYADAAVLVEKTRAEGVEAGLQSDVDDVAADLAQEILDRASAVSAEQDRAEAAELALQGDVDAVAADLAQELLDRAAADTALQGEIDAVEGDLAQELLDRAAADTALQGEVDAVESALAQELLDRAAADTALDGRLDVIEGSGAGSIAKAQADAEDFADAAVLVEKTRAEAAELALQGEVDAVEGDLAQEILDRASAVSAVQGEIDALEAVVADLNFVTKTADEAIAAGKICYIKSNGNIALADADLDMSDAALVIAFEAIASAASGKVVIKEGTVVGGFSGLVPGKKCFVSKTAGGVVQVLTGFESGNSVYCVGRAISASEIAFQPVYEFEY